MQFVGGPFSGDTRPALGWPMPPEHFDGVAFPHGARHPLGAQSAAEVQIEQVRYQLQQVYVGPAEGCEGPGRFGWVYVYEKNVGDHRLADLACRRAVFGPVQS